MTAAIETKNLVKRFGGLLATGDISIALPAGARHALIGPNGAGKTTFVNLLSGALPATSGQVYLGGKDISRWSMHARAKAGLSRTFQINRLFADFTPLETIALVLSEQRGEGAQWWTRVAGKTDGSGDYRTRGFLGNYNVSASARGKTVMVQAKLSAQGEKLTLVLP